MTIPPDLEAQILRYYHDCSRSATVERPAPVLLPCVECILFLFVGEIAIPDNIIGHLEVSCRLFNPVVLQLCILGDTNFLTK